MALISQRSGKVFARLGGTGAGGTGATAGVSPDQATWEIPVLAGYSFSQTTNSTEVTVNEAGFTSRRARVMFNDSLAPVEFSFSTYIRPTSGTVGSTTAVAAEQVLWAMLMGADSFNPTTGIFYSSTMSTSGASPNSVSPATSPLPLNAINTITSSTVNTFDFSASNVSFFPSGNSMIFQVQDGSNFEIFTIANAQISSVTIDFDIEGLATAQWSGMGTSITRANTGTATTPSFNTATGVTGTTNFIRSKLSTMTLASYNDAGSPFGATDSYNIVLTGGSFTIENNLNFLMPEELGKVNQTIGNITGSRSISGTLTCYYDTADGTSQSSELWSDLIQGRSGGVGTGSIPAIRNAHAMTINIGGTTGNRLILSMPTAHFEIPTINPDELFTLEANFHALPSQGNFDNTNEATIAYGV